MRAYGPKILFSTIMRRGIETHQTCSTWHTVQSRSISERVFDAMKKVYLVASFMLITAHAATAQNMSEKHSLYPTAKVSKEEFLLYLSLALIAKEGCENYLVNSQYVNGFIDATGIVPKDEPLLNDLIRQARMQLSQNKSSYCSDVRGMTSGRPLDQRATPLDID